MNKMFQMLIFIGIGMTINKCHHVDRKIYYIDPSGDDLINTGTSAHPWKSLSFACSVALPGEIIHVNSGDYTDNNKCVLRPGVNIEGEGDGSCITTNYIALSWYDGYILLSSDSPGEDGNQSIKNLKLNGNLTSTYAIRGYFRNGITISNVTIEDFVSCGILIRTFPNHGNPTYWTGGHVIEYCNIKNCKSCIQMGGIDGILIHANVFDEAYRFGELTWIMGGEWWKNVKYYNNTSYTKELNNGEWIFSIELWDSFGGNEIHHNSFYGSGTVDIAGSNNLKGDSDYSWWVHHNFFIQSVMRSVVENPHHSYAVAFESNNENTIFENNYCENLTCGVSYSLAQAGGNTVTDARISYNIFKNSGCTNNYYYADIQIVCSNNNSLVDGVYIYNNVMYQGHNSMAIMTRGNVTWNNNTIRNIYISNNIIENVHSAWLSGWYSCNYENYFIKNNVLFNNGNDNNIEPTFLALITNCVEENTIKADPLFINPGNDFHLRFNSPAIDAGLNCGFRYDFDGMIVKQIPDIGVYEFNILIWFMYLLNNS